ncbi:hypothetical protein V5O48_000430 [Marasmius crinis-equi]|uniref:Golgi apparatus membrane protein TVP38 n=1 Tax=Marasmius crinis-equi TaxID=585013 RepID=A0ABR3G198_9AGAR
MNPTYPTPAHTQQQPVYESYSDLAQAPNTLPPTTPLPTEPPQQPVCSSSPPAHVTFQSPRSPSPRPFTPLGAELGQSNYGHRPSDSFGSTTTINDSYGRSPPGPSRTPSPTPSERKALETPSIKALDIRNYLSMKYIWYWVAFAVVLTIFILISVFNDQIVDWLTPASRWLQETSWGWIIPIVLIAILSIPPLFGSGIVSILCGLVWGLWIGFGIVAAGQFFGEIINYYLFKYWCGARAEKFEKKKISYAAMAKVIRDGGFKIALIVRWSSIPEHFATGIFATCGIGIVPFSIAVLLSLPKNIIQVYMGVIFDDDEQDNKQAEIYSAILIAVTIAISIGAYWYIMKQMDKVKPEVVYQRRKERQAKMAKGIYPADTNESELEGNLDHEERIPLNGFKTSRTNSPPGFDGNKLYAPQPHHGAVAMPLGSPPASSSASSKPWLEQLENIELPEDHTHPTQVALRTYLLALSLSLGPSLVPVVSSFVKSVTSNKKGGLANTWRVLKKVLRRELGYDGFAFAITLAVWGGSKLGKTWDEVSENNNDDDKTKSHQSFLSKLNGKLTSYQRGFLSYAFTSTVALYLLQAGRHRSERLQAMSRSQNGGSAYPLIPYTPPTPSPGASKASPTLDLTLLLVVRALDVVVQSLIQKRVESEGEIEEEGVKGEKRRKSIAQLSTKIDAIAFWACSARIMWCFFYEPQRLPQSYVRWIGALANVDKRLLRTLQHLREGTWSYVSGSKLYPTTLTAYAEDLGYPSSWGDPARLPATGSSSQLDWDNLGVNNRMGRGGLPCELVHGGEGSMLGLESSCLGNSGIRGFKAFLEALAIYLPVSPHRPNFDHPTVKSAPTTESAGRSTGSMSECNVPIDIHIKLLVCRLFHANSRIGAYLPIHIPRLLGRTVWMHSGWVLDMWEQYLD